MTICSLCNKKFSFWNSCSFEGDDKTYCPECWKNKKENIEKFKIKEEEDKKREIERRKEEKSGKVMEYKRKCNQCDKVWYSLVDKEKQLGSNRIFNSLVGIGTAITGDLGASTQSSRNLDANSEYLDKLKKCPNCGSADYTEEIIIYKKKH